jgi:RNA polymerase sigma factor for flagellar operon FliA
VSAAVADQRSHVDRRALSRDEFQRYSPVVRRAAMVLARRAPQSVAVTDLCARGWAGLLDALASAEAMGATFDLDGYVTARIRAAMLDYLAGLSGGVREARRESRLLARVIGVLERTLGRAPDEAEIARALELPAEDYEKLLTRIADAGIARLNVLDFDDQSSFTASAEGELEACTLIEAIERLPRNAQQVLALLHQEGCSLSEAATVLGIDEGRVRRVHTEALHRLRASLGKE